MTQQEKKNWRKLPKQVLSQRSPNNMLEVLLELDRMVVEVSMHVYNVSRRDRSTMRKQNRHLHDAVRTHLPRLMKPPRRF